MTEQDLLILQNFASLWARVHNGGKAAAGSADPREAVLEQLYALHDGYRDMAGQTCGSVRRRLLGLERETAAVIRHLQAGRFLDAGDTFIPVKQRNFCKFSAVNLQKLWRIATTLQDACVGEVSGCSPLTAADLQTAGALAEVHQAALRELLRDIL